MGWRVEIQQDGAWKVVPPADYSMSHEEALALAGGYANARIVSGDGSVEPVTERGDSSVAAEHDRPRGRPIPEDEAGITVVDPKTKKTRLFETRGVLGGAYRGKSVSKRELLTHAYEVTEGKWGAEKSLCGKIKAESLSDEDEHAWPSCAACANRLTKLGASAASVRARENPTRAKEQFWPFGSPKFVIYGQHPDGSVEVLTRAKTERGAQVILDEYRRGAKLTDSGIRYWYDRGGAQEKSPRAKENPHAADYPDIEAALLGAQSKFDATHAVRGRSVTIFSPTSKGYIKRVGFHEKGFYHWPEKGEVVSELPSNAEMIYQLIQTGWDPEERQSAPASHRRAAEDWPKEAVWCVTWINPKTRKRQVYFDEMPEHIARQEAYLLKKRAPDADVRVDRCGSFLREEPQRRTAEDVVFYKPGDRVLLHRQNRPGTIDAVDVDPAGHARYSVSYVDRTGEKKKVQVAPYEVRPKFTVATEDSGHADMQRYATRYADAHGWKYVPNSAVPASGGSWDLYVRKGSGGTQKIRVEHWDLLRAAEAKENPIEASNGSGWAKITRDPKAHAEAMARAQEIGPINNAKAVYELLSEKLAKEDQEVFLVLPLDIRGHLRCEPVEVHRGARSRVDVSVPDVLRAVIEAGGEGFCVVHNHPTGLADPSKADGDLTKAIRKGAGNVDLAFVDHVVIGRQQYYSFEDKKLHRVKGKKS